MNKTESAFHQLINLFAHHSDPDKALGMSRYMRNLFPFAGINAETRKSIFITLHHSFQPQNREELISWIQILWESTEREYQYIAMEYLKKYVKLLNDKDLWFFEYLITQKSWWDTVDIISANCLGKFLSKNIHLLESTILEFSQHSNFWINRAAIICQLTFRSKTQTALLTAAIKAHIDSPEFFLQKAIGWALRQYGKTNPEWVIQFVQSVNLKPLSKREALRIILQEFRASK